MPPPDLGPLGSGMALPIFAFEANGTRAPIFALFSLNPIFALFAFHPIFAFKSELPNRY
jgi:hypothetical protein